MEETETSEFTPEELIQQWEILKHALETNNYFAEDRTVLQEEITKLQVFVDNPEVGVNYNILSRGQNELLIGAYLRLHRKHPDTFSSEVRCRRDIAKSLATKYGIKFTQKEIDRPMSCQCSDDLDTTDHDKPDFPDGEETLSCMMCDRSYTWRGHRWSDD